MDNKKQQSPCIGCEHEYKDKNNETCENCPKRIDYISKTGTVLDQFMQKTSGEPTKICTNANCKFKGAPQPLSNFYNNSRFSDGKSAECKTCQREYAKKHYESKKLSESKELLAEFCSKKGMLLIDFTDYPKLHKKLVETAHADFRTIEMQALYFLEKCLKEKSNL